MTSRLNRSIHNQLRICTSPPQLSLPDDDDDDDEDDESLTSKNLSLRRFDLVSTLPDILMQSRPYAVNIKLLDISYSMADTNTLNSLCQHLLHLQTLHARSCGLQGTLNAVSWPEELRSLDLSRNELCECPQGLQKLMYLSSLNISGNSIKFVPPLLLKIPCLRRCLLVNNPIGNVPKNVCREGVERMRVFLEVEPLPMPKDMPLKGSIRTSTRFRRHSSGSSLESCKNLRRYILSQQGSFESGYESNQRHHSSSSASSDCVSIDIEFSESSDIESDSIASNQQWKRFDSGTELPKGYVNASVNQFCRVYLPEDCKGGIEIHDVKDMSFHPMLKDNELLVTSVIRVTPHGRTFESKPAIIVLPHCTKKGFSQMNLIPMCSNTGEFETTDWMAIDPFPEVCEIFENHIMFTTSHFSFFAVVASFPYPSSSIRVGPNIGGDLLIPELPLFSLHIPDNSLAQSITIKGTVYYCDSAYRPPNDYALASACVGLEPHGTEFNNPVIVRVPIPDYRRIRAHYPDAKLELWCSLKSIGDADIPCDWNRTKDVNIQLDSSCQIATFEITHFSRYEFIWNIGSTLLQKLGLGAATIYNTLSSRSRFISVRLQAFMSQPYLRSLTFGLVVTVFKFGDPLLPPSNYPLLVADSGTKRIHLRVGDLHVKIEGCFSASLDVGEELERKGRIVDFTGEDFCERFEFALNLKSDVPFPLQEGQVLGKLRFIQWENSNPLQKSYNLMMPSNPVSTMPAAVTPPPPTTTTTTTTTDFRSYLDFTPPRSPEPESIPVSGHTLSPQGDVPTGGQWLGKRRRQDSGGDGGSCLSTCTPKRRILMCQSDITDRDLMSISHACGSKYVDLGIGLGLNYSTIMNRLGAHEGKSEHLKAFEVLQEWKSRDFSYDVLAQALEDIGLGRTALKYCYASDNFNHVH